jgi:hypothetical protein
MLHFAYGANMDGAIMRKHAPCATPLGVASLKDHRFVITADGYASVESVAASTVYGVLWRITSRDRTRLDLWEGTVSGLYSTEAFAVHAAEGRQRALVYLARRNRLGRPRAGYMQLVLAAARAWNLPPHYIASLQHWLPAQPLGAGARNLKEFGWT